MYKTERKAKDEIDVCVSDDQMWESASLYREASTSAACPEIASPNRPPVRIKVIQAGGLELDFLPIFIGTSVAFFFRLAPDFRSFLTTFRDLFEIGLRRVRSSP